MLQRPAFSQQQGGDSLQPPRRRPSNASSSSSTAPPVPPPRRGSLSHGTREEFVQARRSLIALPESGGSASGGDLVAPREERRARSSSTSVRQQRGAVRFDAQQHDNLDTLMVAPKQRTRTISNTDDDAAAAAVAPPLPAHMQGHLCPRCYRHLPTLTVRRQRTSQNNNADEDQSVVVEEDGYCYCVGDGDAQDIAEDDDGGATLEWAANGAEGRRRRARHALYDGSDAVEYTMQQRLVSGSRGLQVERDRLMMTSTASLHAMHPNPVQAMNDLQAGTSALISAQGLPCGDLVYGDQSVGQQLNDFNQGVDPGSQIASAIQFW